MSSDEDTFFGIPNPLKETGENEAVEDGTPLPEDLEKDAKTPATVAYVKRMMKQHRQTCPAIRRLRRWAMFASFALGGLLVLNGLGLVFGKSWIREAVRDGVRAELKDRGLATLATDNTYQVLMR